MVRERQAAHVKAYKTTYGKDVPIKFASPANSSKHHHPPASTSCESENLVRGCHVVDPSIHEDSSFTHTSDPENIQQLHDNSNSTLAMDPSNKYPQSPSYNESCSMLSPTAGGDLSDEVLKCETHNGDEDGQVKVSNNEWNMDSMHIPLKTTHDCETSLNKEVSDVKFKIPPGMEDVMLRETEGLPDAYLKDLVHEVENEREIARNTSINMLNGVVVEKTGNRESSVASKQAGAGDHTVSSRAPRPSVVQLNKNEVLEQLSKVGIVTSDAYKNSGSLIEIPRNQFPGKISGLGRPMYTTSFASNSGTVGQKSGVTTSASDERFMYASDYFQSCGPSLNTGKKQSSTCTFVMDTDNCFDVNKAMNCNSKDGWGDVHSYITVTQANNDIKALLEGGFEDDGEKPQLKLRRSKRLTKKAESVVNLTDGLAKLTVCEQNEPDEEDGSVDGLAVKLLPHQIEGVAWLMDRETGKKRNGVLPKGGILADDMGLGKTIQSIALILLNDREYVDGVPDEVSRSTLIVAPLAMIRQWEREIADKVLREKKLRILVHHGSNRIKRGRELERYDIVITTYQCLVTEYGADERIGCFDVFWYRVVLDEAHIIKNRRAKCTLAAYELNSWFRICLSGTPMQNNLDEIQSLIRFLRVKPYSDYGMWREQIIKPMKQGKGGLSMRRLQCFLKVIMKRRTKDVLGEGKLTMTKGKGKETSFEIVEKKVEIVEVELSKEERKFYEKLEEMSKKSLAILGDGRGRYMGALVLLMRLRQACNHSQLVIDGLRSSGNRRDENEMEEMTRMFKGMEVSEVKCIICQESMEQSNGKRCCETCLCELSGAQLFLEKAKRKVYGGDYRMQEEAGDRDGSDEEGPDGDGPKRQSRSDETIVPENGGSERGSSDGADCEVLASAKMRELMKILRHEVLSSQGQISGNKIIIFSQFTSMLDIIEDYFDMKGIAFVRYDGSMKNEDREASLRELWKSDSPVRILLCSLKCGSLGLNLTCANRVVLLEPFWNPFVEAQAIDRVHRINQNKKVKVYRLTVLNSVEQRILRLQESKLALANAALSGSKNHTEKLSFQDILRLFGSDQDIDVDPKLEITNDPLTTRVNLMDDRSTSHTHPKQSAAAREINVLNNLARTAPQFLHQ